jgi:hypothetical protein
LAPWRFAVRSAVICRYAGGQRRWTATVEGGVARIAGDFDDATEQGVVAVLARTVPGVAAVDLGTAPAGPRSPRGLEHKTCPPASGLMARGSPANRVAAGCPTALGGGWS